MSTQIFTIGFTQKQAEEFFDRLLRSGVKRVVDVRLNNRSQLAGFAKRDDLRFFLQSLGGIEYVECPILAPTQEMLDEYKKKRGAWADYEEKFVQLMRDRTIETNVSRELLDDSCLLCSEDKPHHCHRRLVAEYLRDNWHDVEIKHL